MRLIQVVSVRGSKYNVEDTKQFFEKVEKAVEKDCEFTPLLLSATCGDIMGYFTLLVGIPEDVPEDVTDGIGNSLALALIGKYDVINDAGYNGREGQWIMTATGKPEVMIREA